MDLDSAEIQLFCLKMRFGISVSSGAGKCANSSQAFSLYCWTQFRNGGRLCYYVLLNFEKSEEVLLLCPASQIHETVIC